MNKFENIYLRLPYFLQNVAVNLQGLKTQIRRYGTGYQKLFKDIRARQEFSETQFKQWRISKLKKFLISANNTIYWNRKFKQFNLNCYSDDPFCELKKLPIIGKDEVKKNLGEIRNLKFQGQSIRWEHTSGSTGSGMIFPELKNTEKSRWAYWWRYREWHSIKRNMWCGVFGGRSLVPINVNVPPFWRINYPAKQILFSGYHMSTDTVCAYLNAINDFEVEWMHGYPSLLNLIAQLGIDKKFSKDFPKLKVITTGAENLSEYQKNTITKFFGAKVVQHYGLAESVANISECEKGNLHVDEDFSCVEFTENPNDLKSSKIIGTNWYNPAFPLLRYDTGDLAVCGDIKCRCGRLGRVIEKIDGRNEDYLLLPSGVKLGRLDHIFKDIINIREAQFVQINNKLVVLNIVPGSNFSNHDEDKLNHEIRQRIGNEIEIRIDYINKIKRSRSGKVRLVVSKING